MVVKGSQEHSRAQLESLWEGWDFLLKSVLLSTYLKTTANKVCLNKRVSWRQCTRKKRLTVMSIIERLKFVMKR